MKQTAASHSTPDEILRAMELQLAAARSARTKPAGGPRLALLIGGLLVIIAVGAVALLILQQMLSDLPRPAHTQAQPPLPNNFANVESGGTSAA